MTGLTRHKLTIKETKFKYKSLQPQLFQPFREVIYFRFARFASFTSLFWFWGFCLFLHCLFSFFGVVLGIGTFILFLCFFPLFSLFLLFSSRLPFLRSLGPSSQPSNWASFFFPQLSFTPFSANLNSLLLHLVKLEVYFVFWFLSSSNSPFLRGLFRLAKAGKHSLEQAWPWPWSPPIPSCFLRLESSAEPSSPIATENPLSSRIDSFLYFGLGFLYVTSTRVSLANMGLILSSFL